MSEDEKELPEAVREMHSRQEAAPIPPHLVVEVVGFFRKIGSIALSDYEQDPDFVSASFPGNVSVTVTGGEYGAFVEANYHRDWSRVPQIKELMDGLTRLAQLRSEFMKNGYSDDSGRFRDTLSSGYTLRMNRKTDTTNERLLMNELLKVSHILGLVDKDQFAGKTGKRRKKTKKTGGNK